MLKKRYLTNWQDSMALNAEILNEHDNYFIDTINDSIAIRATNYNYGLLPMQNADKDNHIQARQTVANCVEVTLSACDAITQSGARIKLQFERGSELSKTYSFVSDLERGINHWDIVLLINPYERIGCGPLNPQETPPRHPHAEATYKLFLMPKGEFNMENMGADYLIIARVNKTSEGVSVDSNFIPPCTTLNSHLALKGYYHSFVNLIRQIEIASKLISSKITQRATRDPLAIDVLNLCADILRYSSEVSFELKNKGLYYSPIDFVGVIARLAHRIYVSLLLVAPLQKEDMLKYFYEWSDIKPGTFEEIIIGALELDYDHLDIRCSMVQCEIFLRNFSELWSKLSSLQYIGQHKENIVISERTTAQNVETESRTWSL